MPRLIGHYDSYKRVLEVYLDRPRYPPKLIAFVFSDELLGETERTSTCNTKAHFAFIADRNSGANRRGL